MTDKDDLKTTLNKQISDVSGAIRSALSEHISEMKIQPKLSTSTIKEIKKRTGPRTYDKYANPHGAIDLLSCEAYDLGHRISRYRYIERYKHHLNTTDNDMKISLLMHTLLMRGSEIYVIMERAKCFLKFLHYFATDLDLKPEKPQYKCLERSFKKDFKRHLQERHRIVHAHERPSLHSRITAIAPSDEARLLFKSQSTLKELLIEMFQIDQKMKYIYEKSSNYNEFVINMKENQLIEVDNECVSMWSTFTLGIYNTIETPNILRSVNRTHP